MRPILLSELFFCVALLSGCGVPGEPLPPLLEIPAPISDLVAAQVGDQIELSWAPPRLTTEGTRARRLDRIEIYASFYPESAPVSGAPEPADLFATISPQSAPETEDRMHLNIRLDPSRPGMRAVIAAKVFNDRGRDAGFSNVVTLPLANLPEPPSALAGDVTERSVRLRWQPAARSVFGTEPAPVDGYQVFRRAPGSPAPGTMIGEAQTPEYDDASFEFEQTYAYSVRAFVRREGTVAVTRFSPEAEIAVTDRFPPAAPEDLRAVAVPGAVEIAWSPNEEADLAGYFVYRNSGGGFERIHAEPLRIPVFRDAQVRPGAEYRYHVRAIDRKGNESEPSEEAALTAE